MNAQKRTKTSVSMYNAVFIILISLIILSCATVNSDWNAARERNTKQAYQEFLEKHPNSKKTTEAEAAIESFSWNAAEKEDSETSYVQYLKEFPEGLHSAAARKRLETIVWNEACTRNSVEAYTRFIKYFRKSLMIPEAKTRLDTLNWNAAEHENTVSSYRSYINDSREGKLSGIFADEAGRRLNDLLRDSLLSNEEISTLVENLQKLINPYSLSDLYKECTIQSAPKKSNELFGFSGSSSGGDSGELSQVLKLEGISKNSCFDVLILLANSFVYTILCQ